jgi:hypothetical protein
MKYMIASDIHGSAKYCRRMLEAYRAEQPDKLILLGDILYHGPRNDLPEEYAPKEVIAMLNPLAAELLCVRGNCEAEVDQMVLDFPVLADYAVFYNWLVKERLQLRVGGSFNVFGGFAIGDDNAINNLLSVDIQTQFYAKAQIRYGWDFKKFGLDLYANLATPFMGMMVVDERYENAVDAVGKSDFSLKEYGHCKFSSMHNLQGMNFEMGIDFAFRNLALSLSYEAKNRWWHAYELQNYRRFSLIKLGLSVNLFAQPNRKVSNRQF